jgi:type I restriction enzyme S subunit
MIPVCTLEEQILIIQVLEERLSVLEAEETEIDTAIAKANALRQSILKRAFSGQLVAQDPADEPASALLARLRGTAPVLKTRRKKTA